MGTAFDDFIEQQKQNKLANPVNKPTSYIRKSGPIPHPILRSNTSKPTTAPQVKRPQNIHIKSYAPPRKTEFSGADFEPRVATGYPKGALNVLIVFFTTFVQEILYMLNTSSKSSWDTTADDYDPNSDNN